MGEPGIGALVHPPSAVPAKQETDMDNATNEGLSYLLLFAVVGGPVILAAVIGYGSWRSRKRSQKGTEVPPRT
jgi:hypothetical protein